MSNKTEFKQDLSRTVNLNYLAQLHCSKNEFAHAEKLYKEVLDIVSSNTSENDAELIMPLHRLGLVCRILEKFSEAETYYKRAYLLAMQNYKLNDVRIASRANFMAGLYNATEQYDLSEIMLRHSQVLYEKAAGKESQQVEFTLLALALVVRLQGDEKRADELYKQSVAIGQRKKPAGDANKLTQEVAALAQKFYGMKQYEEAEALFRYALIIGEENFWPEHPFVIEAFQKIGEWDLAQQSYEGAAEFLEQAAQRAERLHGVDSPQLIDIYEKWHQALEKSNNPKAAQVKIKLINVRPAP